MTLPTTKPNDRDLAWYVRECEWLDDRNRVLERENAALNHKLDEILTNKNYEGGVQFWINKHDEVLLREASFLAENAALRAERVLVSVHTGKFTTISGRAMICPDCGRALLHEDRAAIDAARKEAQP